MQFKKPSLEFLMARSPDKSSSKFLRHGGLRIQLLPGAPGGWGLDMYATDVYNKGGKRTNSSFIVSNLGLILTPVDWEYLWDRLAPVDQEYLHMSKPPD
ncbi:hypothetical protein CK203_047006 [Vitis vinifera]|uniref:Uncharacterized protein n=1 Tax=Vitis vinifera TaxID=29760 RepID=A0A438FWH7_VITVI|nr:hypothetical protein CK203_047006 [Vitis vinifera]